jgi:hypothetical protein
MRLVLFSMLVALAFPQLASALPSQFMQEGLVTDGDGRPFDGRHTVIIRLYAQVEGGQPFFEETHRNVVMVQGYYAIGVGSVVELNGLDFLRDAVWLGMTIDQGREATPRTPMVQVPAALVADVARNATGDITPRSVAVGGQVVIDDRGRWVGPPVEVEGVADPDTPRQVLAKLVQVDGAGSTLDADTLDGHDSEAFVRTGAQLLALLTGVDGPNSGIDADRLDGKDSSEFVTTAAQILALLKTVDGADSGLDADRLDGVDSTQFVRGAGQVRDLLKTVDGTGSGVDADRLDGLDSTQFLRTNAAASADAIMTIVKANDGAGSGVDADTVDGIGSTHFMRVDQNTGTTGVLTAERLDVHPAEIAGGNRAWMVDGLKVGAGGSDNAYFGMKDEGANAADAVIAWGDDVGDHLRFIFAASGGPADGAEYMRVTSAGKIGMGKADPAHALDVAGTVGATALQLEPLEDPPADPTAGRVYLDADHVLKVYNGEEWVPLSKPSAGGGAGGIAYRVWNAVSSGVDATNRLPYSVTYQKKAADSLLKLTFSSNLRTAGAAGHCCRWALRVNGQHCAPSVNGNVYINPGGNWHQHRTINGICRNIPAGQVTVEPWIEQCPGYGVHDCHTGWNSMTALIVEEIPAQPNLMAWNAWDALNRQEDATRALPISVSYNKKEANSLLELTFTSSMRNYPNNGSCCRWALRVNGAQCNPALNANVYISPGGDYHHIRTLTGLCPNIGAGNVTVQPWVEQCPGYGNSDCYTGWQSTTALIVRERPAGDRIKHATAVNGNWGHDATNPLPISIAYDKQEADTPLRLTFSSNMRTYPNNATCCRWAIRVNGNNCGPPVNGNVYISPGGNYHQHRTITGMCDNIGAGRITVQPWVEQCPGYGAVDCYTGWQSTSTLIVEEGPF